jgi:predicted ATP-dependent serine protease
MVKELVKKGKTFYICEACGFAYEQEEWAEKCQEWCEKHNSCNLEITQHAISLED